MIVIAMNKLASTVKGSEELRTENVFTVCWEILRRYARFQDIGDNFSIENGLVRILDDAYKPIPITQSISRFVKHTVSLMWHLLPTTAPSSSTQQSMINDMVSVGRHYTNHGMSSVGPGGLDINMAPIWNARYSNDSSYYSNVALRQQFRAQLEARVNIAATLTAGFILSRQKVPWYWKDVLLTSSVDSVGMSGKAPIRIVEKFASSLSNLSSMWQMAVALPSITSTTTKETSGDINKDCLGEWLSTLQQPLDALDILGPTLISSSNDEKIISAARRRLGLSERTKQNSDACAIVDKTDWRQALNVLISVLNAGEKSIEQVFDLSNDPGHDPWKGSAHRWSLNADNRYLSTLKAVLVHLRKQGSDKTSQTTRDTTTIVTAPSTTFEKPHKTSISENNTTNSTTVADIVTSDIPTEENERVIRPKKTLQKKKSTSKHNTKSASAAGSRRSSVTRKKPKRKTKKLGNKHQGFSVEIFAPGEAARVMYSDEGRVSSLELLETRSCNSETTSGVPSEVAHGRVLETVSIEDERSPRESSTEIMGSDMDQVSRQELQSATSYLPRVSMSMKHATPQSQEAFSTCSHTNRPESAGAIQTSEQTLPKLQLPSNSYLPNSRSTGNLTSLEPGSDLKINLNGLVSKGAEHNAVGCIQIVPSNTSSAASNEPDTNVAQDDIEVDLERDSPIPSGATSPSDAYESFALYQGWSNLLDTNNSSTVATVNELDNDNATLRSPSYDVGRESWVSSAHWFPELQVNAYTDIMHRRYWAAACKYATKYKTESGNSNFTNIVTKALAKYKQLRAKCVHQNEEIIRQLIETAQQTRTVNSPVYKSLQSLRYTSIMTALINEFPHLRFANVLEYDHICKNYPTTSQFTWQTVVEPIHQHDRSIDGIRLRIWPTSELSAMTDGNHQSIVQCSDRVLSSNPSLSLGNAATPNIVPSNVYTAPNGINSVKPFLLYPSQFPSVLHARSSGPEEFMTLLNSELRSRLSQRYMLATVARAAATQSMNYNDASSLRALGTTVFDAFSTDITSVPKVQTCTLVHSVYDLSPYDSTPDLMSPSVDTVAADIAALSFMSPRSATLARHQSQLEGNTEMSQISRQVNVSHVEDATKWPSYSRMTLPLDKILKESLAHTRNEIQSQDLNRFTSPPLVFESRFESGNLRSAVRVSEYEYELMLEPDTNTNGHTQWFNFYVSGMNLKNNCSTTTETSTYTFHIVNLEKPGSSFNDGMRPLAFVHASEEESSLSNEENDVLWWPTPAPGSGWRRIGCDVVYYTNQYTKMKRQVGITNTQNKTNMDDEGVVRSLYTESWRVVFPPNTISVFFCYCFPYTYSDLGRDIVRWQNRSSRLALGIRVPVVESCLDSTNGLPLCLQSKHTREFQSKTHAHTAADKYNVLITRAHPHDHTENLQHVTLGLPDWSVLVSKSNDTHNNLSNGSSSQSIKPMWVPHGSLFSSSVLVRSVLCHTIAGNPVPLLTITDFTDSSDTSDFSRFSYSDKPNEIPFHTAVPTIDKPIPFRTAMYARPVIVLSGRVHPGESNASWMMRGVLDFMTSSAPIAKALRSRCIVKVIPILNPDGVINGHHRTNLSGVDLNRHWSEPDPDVVPSVWHLKQLVTASQNGAGGNVLLYCDFHGHSRRKNIFIFGCDPAATSNSGVGVHTQGLKPGAGSVKTPSQAWASKLFPRLLARRASVFSADGCSFKVQKSKSNCGRVAAWRDVPLVNSYTIEASFAGADSGPTKDIHFQPQHYEELGHHFCAALHDMLNYYHLHPERASEAGAVPRIPIRRHALEQLISLPPQPINSPPNDRERNTMPDSTRCSWLLPSPMSLEKTESVMVETARPTEPHDTINVDNNPLSISRIISMQSPKHILEEVESLEHEHTAIAQNTETPAPETARLRRKKVAKKRMKGTNRIKKV